MIRHVKQDTKMPEKRLSVGKLVLKDEIWAKNFIILQEREKYIKQNGAKMMEIRQKIEVMTF